MIEELINLADGLDGLGQSEASDGGSARKPKRAPTIKNSDRLIMFSNILKLATGMVSSFDFDHTIR